MEELIASGLQKEQLIFLNFEDPRLIGIHFKDLREIIKLQWQLYPNTLEKTFHLFIDEPQNLSQWEVAVRNLSEEGFPIYITGSSSKLLSKEIATNLRGRTLTYTLLPFSFKEFLKKRLSHTTLPPAQPLQ